MPNCLLCLSICNALMCLRFLRGGARQGMNTLSELDRSLLTLLSANSRKTVSDLAKELGVSRLTVQAHMETLERQNIIQGYTIRWHSEFTDNQIEAHILIATDQKKLSSIVKALKNIEVIGSLSSISGEFDLVANIIAHSTQELDKAMDNMSLIDGVLRTQTSVLLSKKFER